MIIFRHKSSEENWLGRRTFWRAEGWSAEVGGGAGAGHSSFCQGRLPLSPCPSENWDKAATPSSCFLLRQLPPAVSGRFSNKTCFTHSTKCWQSQWTQMPAEKPKEKGNKQSHKWPLSNNKRGSRVPYIIYALFFLVIPWCLRKSSNSRIGRVSAYKLSQQEIQGPN